MARMEEAVRARSVRPVPNPRARVALLVGIVAAAAIPVGVGWAIWTYHTQGTAQLRASYVSVFVALPLGILAVFLGRSGMRTSWLSLGRVGGAGIARFGWACGLVSIYLSIMALLAYGFYGILLAFQ